MWPKPRPTRSAYQPLSSTSDHPNPSISLWPTASIPTSQLLGGTTKLSPSLLLGGSTPIAEHLLFRPNFAKYEPLPPPQKDDEPPLPQKEDELDPENDHEDDEFEHLDYQEPDDEMSLTATSRLTQRFPRLSLRSVVVGATVVVLGGGAVAVAVFFAVQGAERPGGREDSSH